MSWEKVGVTVASKPAAMGSGLYLRVPKNLVEAYDLWTVKMVEFTIERAKRLEPGERNVSEKPLRPKREGERQP